MIAKEGRIILIPLLLITFPIGIYAHASNNNILIILYSILGLLFLFSLNFFRDPVRVVPNDKGTVISAKSTNGTTHPDQNVIKLVVDHVKKNVKFKAQPGAPIRTAYYTVQIDAG